MAPHAPVSSRNMRAWCRDVLALRGVGRDAAVVVADHLADAEAAGYASHGVARLPDYVSDLEAGRLQGDAEVRPRLERPDGVVVDASGVMGIYALTRLLDELLHDGRGEPLTARGDAVTAVQWAAAVGGGHTGRLGAFAERGAKAGFVTLVVAGSAGHGEDAIVAPAGGAQRFLGTNPIAIGAPASGGDMIFDMSTAAKTYYGLLEGQELSASDGLNADGYPASDVRDVLDGGCLLPLAGHKGYGLGLLVVALLALAHPVVLSGSVSQSVLGSFVLVIDPRFFTGDEAYRELLGAVLHRVRGIRSSSSEPVYVPGDGSRRRRRTSAPRMHLSDQTTASLERLGMRVGMPPPWAP